MYKVITVLICIMLFCGCSVENELMPLEHLRQSMERSQGCEFSAQVTAQYEDRVYRFALRCAEAADGFRFEVVEPESIRGITGTVEEKGGNLVFDDCLLAFPLLADGELSPVSSPWLFLRSLKSGLIRHAAQTEEGVCLSLEDSFRGEELVSEISITADGVPTHCELFWAGKRILIIHILDFRFL